MRRRYAITGIVQGVGFRPYVFRLATSLGLGGFVANTREGVIVEIEGGAEAAARFASRLAVDAPVIATLGQVVEEPLVPVGERSFVIRPSRCQATSATRAQAPPDLALCERCRTEIFDPMDRRYRYAFTNCTLCGPRYTIIERLPYDRLRTSMARFPLCSACATEYADPLDRRFHAEPTACPACGPRLWVTDAQERTLAGDPIEVAAAALAAGRIVALKGLGGFQIAVDAANGTAVATLRARKQRPAKPFALMVRDLDEAHRLVRMGSAEAALLASPERPIVLLAARPQSAELVAPEVAPGENRLGVFLPTTALHELLLASFGNRTGRRALVMTSGNRSGEPIACTGVEARHALGGVADLFLDHDRPIVMSADDSVVRADSDPHFVIRRGRGQAPSSFSLGGEAPPILASGEDRKNAICLVRGAEAFLGGHVADLESLAAEDRWRETTRHLAYLLGVEPVAIAVDMHPDARSTRLGRELAASLGVPAIAVQHHHAHIASCLVESGNVGPVLGVALDGAGYGPDGTIWGGEILIADRAHFRRAAHLAPVALPGGDRAASEPWRMAVSHLEATYGQSFLDLPLSFLTVVPARRLAAVRELVQVGTGSPTTTSAGRLFDAVAAILGLCLINRHEGEAAMALEAAASLPESMMAADEAAIGEMDFGGGSSGDLLELPVRTLIRQAVDDMITGRSAGAASQRFHCGLAELFAGACCALRARTGLGTVALSGGVFQNAIFTAALVRRLEHEGFEVLRHRRVPPGDGGIALGQAAVAAEEISSTRARPQLGAGQG